MHIQFPSLGQIRLRMMFLSHLAALCHPQIGRFEAGHQISETCTIFDKEHSFFTNLRGILRVIEGLCKMMAFDVLSYVELQSKSGLYRGCSRIPKYARLGGGSCGLAAMPLTSLKDI